MGEIEVKGDVVAEILGDIDRAITDLVLARLSVHRVDPGAFGGSPAGAATRRKVVAAYDGLQQTLTMLEAVHDDFRSHMREMQGRFAAVDEQAGADAARQQRRIDEIAVGGTGAA